MMELEREFIMRIINNPDFTMQTAIRPDDLVVPAYRAAFAAVLRLIGQGVKPDQITVISECREYAVELARLNTLEISNFPYFDRELSKEIQKRRLRIAAQTFVEMMGDGEEAKDVIAKIESMISASKVEHDHRDIKSLYQCAMEFGPILEQRAMNKGELVGIPTGFEKLDELTGGFQPGTYYIGARPSQGKTALMLTMMRAALHAGHGSGLVSIESSDMELISRVLSAEGPVMASGLKKGSLTRFEYNGLSDALKRIEKYNGQIYFNTKTDVETLEAVARRMIKTFNIEILFIDYLQRVNSKGGSKFEQVANASRAVTDIAKGLGIPVVCLAQTGRIADQEAPSLGHFQYSSAIEQDADVAMVIHHPKGDDGREESFLSVLKNRDGEVGSVPVFFDRNHVRFTKREVS